MGYGQQTARIVYKPWTGFGFKPNDSEASVDIITFGLSKFYDVKSALVASPLLRVKWVELGVITGSFNGFYVSPLNIGVGLRIRLKEYANLQPTVNYGYAFLRANERWTNGGSFYPELRLNFSQMSFGFVYVFDNDYNPEIAGVSSTHTKGFLFTVGVLL